MDTMNTSSFATRCRLTFCDERKHGPSPVTGYAIRLSDARPIMGRDFIPDDLQEYIDCDEHCTLSLLTTDDALEEARENAIELLKAGEVTVNQYEIMMQEVEGEVVKAWREFWRYHWGLC